MSNPWLPSLPESTPPPQPVLQSVVGWQPQRLDVPSLQALPTRRVHASHGLWVVGAHGGAGTTTWAHVLACGDAGQAWPVSDGLVRCVVAARSHRVGLEAARRVAIQWASGVLPRVELVGLLLTPDAPGRTPKPLREVTESVSGAFPHVFTVPWMEEWRVTTQVDAGALDKKVARIRDALSHMR